MKQLIRVSEGNVFLAWGHWRDRERGAEDVMRTRGDE
jgi:hypothetical protein